MRDVILLASGPSVRKYNIRDLEQRGHLIALSGSAMYTRPHSALTMDRKVAEVCYPIWQIQGIPTKYLRESIAKNFRPDDETFMFECDVESTTMSDDPRILNGSNTGTCGLNLAYQLRPERVFLLGYDMQRDVDDTPYWHPTYHFAPEGAAENGRLATWAKEFEIIAAQFAQKKIQVLNVNHRSLIEAFPRISFEKFLEMTK